MGYLTLDEALKIPGRNTVDFEVRELGGLLKLAEPSAAKSFEWRMMEARKKGNEDVERKQMELLLRAGVITAEGTPFFKDDTEVKRFVETVSVTTMQSIIAKILELMVPAEKKQVFEKAKAELEAKAAAAAAGDEGKA